MEIINVVYRISLVFLEVTDGFFEIFDKKNQITCYNHDYRWTVLDWIIDIVYL